MVKSPILFLIFNRPDITNRVFEEIRKAKPQRLYIAADGPRNALLSDEALCLQTRQIVDLIDWDCDLKTLFRNSNLGCKYAVSSAISWFFECEEEGIILEDDCLPNSDFFSFCDQMLKKYRHDTRIRHICGCNLNLGKVWGRYTYYFSRNTHVWGWASWRRAWKDYDAELSKFNITEVETELKKVFDEPLLIESWMEIFKNLKSGLIDTWDYQLTLINYLNNSLSIIPNYNLISNIGFRADGTHVVNPEHPLAGITLEELPPEILDPQFFLAETSADKETLYRDFKISERKTNHRTLKNRFEKLFGFRC